jgi:tetratricopeptide (TPR) repeat protein
VRLNAARARADVLLAADRAAEARVLVDEVMRLAATELPADSPQLVDLFELRAEVALDLGDLTAALADQREARHRIGVIWGDDHVYAGIAEATIAGILLVLERRAEALEAFEHGAAIEGALTERPAMMHLELLVSLVAVAWELGERDRAIELAARARALVARGGLEDSQHARALAEHPVSGAAPPR